jgi:hypothetical protein
LNHRSTYLDINFEGVLVGVAQTAHVLEVCRRDGETEVDVRWLHKFLQMIVVTDMTIIVKTLMINTRFQCQRRGIGSLVVTVVMAVVHMLVVVHSPGVCCVREGFHSDRGWKREIIGFGRGCKGWLFNV